MEAFNKMCAYTVLITPIVIRVAFAAVYVKAHLMNIVFTLIAIWFKTTAAPSTATPLLPRRQRRSCALSPAAVGARHLAGPNWRTAANHQQLY